MMKFFIAVVFLSIIFFSCSTNTSQQPDGESKDSSVYYPVHEYFLNEVKDVDSTPFYIYKLSEKNGKKDSAGISKQAFKELAKQFLSINTNEAAFKKNYQETVFEDNSTNSITLTYLTRDKSLPIQNIVVLLSNDGQKVKRIFITTSYSHNDSVINEKSGWKTGEEFYINRSIDKAGNPVLTETNTIVWNKKE